MKQHKISLSKRILALVMVLVLLVPFCSILLSVKEYTVEPIVYLSEPLPTGDVTVSLEWCDGVVTNSDGVALPYSSGADQSSATYNMPFKIKVTGTITKPIKVTVETFDLSATAGEDYAATKLVFELTEETKNLPEYNSGTVTVLYQRAPKIVDGNPVTDENGQLVTELDYVTRIQSTGEVFTEQFGLRITDAENAKCETGKDTIRSSVLAESNHVLNVVKNSSGTLYGCGDSIIQNFSDGYVYDGLGKSYTKENFKIFNTVPEKATRATDIKHPEHPYFEVINSALSNNPTLQRLYALYPDAMETWIGGWVTVDDDKNGERWGFSAEIIEDAPDSYIKSLYIEDYDKRNWNGQRFELLPSSISSGDAAFSRNGSYPNLKFVPTRSDSIYTFYVFNYEDVDWNKSKKDFELSYSAIIVNRTALVLESYSMDNRAYGAGDTVYLTLKFNKPVQISGTTPLSIQASMGESTKKYFDFVYCGGNMTDTLVFKTTLPAEGEGDYYGNYFKLLEFNNESQYTNAKGSGQIADMFWNKVNKNNAWTPTDAIIANKTLPCTIDTRTPVIGDASSVPEQVQTAVSSSVTISKITADATVWVAWTEDENPPDSDGWGRTAFSIVGDTTTVTLNQSGASGIFYAHVKAISVSGAQTIRTFGPFKLDNLEPVLYNFKIVNDLISSSATKYKTLQFNIKDQLAWDSETDMPFSKVYVKITDAGTGENGINSKLLDKTDGYYDNVSFDADGNLLVYEKGKTNNIMTLESTGNNYDYKATIKISCVEESGTVKLINLDENPIEGTEAKETGSYNIGFYVVDKFGNKSDITYFDGSRKPTYQFDTRDVFDLEVDYANTYWYPSAPNPYNYSDLYENGMSYYWTDDGTEIKSVTWENAEEAQIDYETYPKQTAPNGTPIFYKEDLFYSIQCNEYGKNYTDKRFAHISLTGDDKINNSGTVPVYIKVNGVEQEFVAFWSNGATNFSIVDMPKIDAQGNRVIHKQMRCTDNYPVGKENLIHYRLGDLFIPADLEGCVEIQLINQDKISTVYTFFVLSKNSNSLTDNYNSLYAEDRLMKNEVWQLSTAKFYSGENRNGANYNSKGVTPIFSSKDMALEYAKFFEKQDVVIEYIDDEIEASKLESGLYSNFRKADADKNVTVKKGQTWVRYKSINWTLNSGNEEQWVYYYYCDGKVSSLDPQLTRNINEAIERNAKLICNYDGNNKIYLTANNVSQNSINKYGEPQYDSYGILTETKKYRGIYNSDVICSEDFAIYDSFINVSLSGAQDEVKVPIVSNYVFKLSAEKNGYAEFRQYGTEAWTAIFDGENIKDMITASGLYEIREYGAGYRKYLIYVDVDAPVISYQLTVDKNNKTGVITNLTSGGTLRASNFKITGIVTSPNGNFSVEQDRWAYFYVMSVSGIGSGRMYAFMTASELNANGCELETGIYKIYAYDRLGNMIMQEVKINTEDLDIQHSINQNGLTVTINRDSKDVLEGSFKVWRDNVPLTNISYSKTLQFTRSGLYRVEITDVYGNSMSKEFAFNRSLPSVSFSRQKKAGSGVYERIEVNSTNQNALSTVISDDNHQLFTISTAVNIRISYPSGSGYEFDFIGTVPEYTTSGVTTKNIDINSTETNWVLKIYHQSDPEVYIIITCIVDKEAPVITGDVRANEYEYNEFKGATDNVLFTPTESITSAKIFDGELVVGDSAVISWTDETKVSNVYYSFNGGAMTLIDGSIGSYVFTNPGTYAIEAVDMFGNVSSFKFTLVHQVDFTFAIDGVEQELDHEPLNNIINGTQYTKTTYTGKEATFVIKENSMLALYYTDGTDSYVYNMEFTIEQGVATLTVCSDYDVNSGDFGDYKHIDVTTDNSGTVFGGNIGLSYQYINGILTLTLSECTKEYELFQLRVSDLNGHIPVVVQLERSNLKPEFEILREDNVKLDLSYNGFVGSNQKLLLNPSSVSANTTEIVAYYSESYTTNFANAEKLILYGNGADPHIEKEGYYKIVAVNKYGNEKVIYVAVRFTLSIDVHINYEKIKQRSQTYSKPDTYSIYSNKSVNIVIWDVRASIVCLKDGNEFNVTPTAKNGCLEFSLSEIGEYTVKISDESGNSYNLNVSVKAPKTLAYSGFIIGFNENALKREQNYTNGALSLDKQRVEDGGIKYIALRKLGSSDLTVLYDIVGLDHVGYSEATFVNSIGTEDGVYEVLFCDYYGDLHIETVSISRKPLLDIERQTQDITQGVAYDFDFAVQNGAWSNYILTFINSSENYLLKVDGQDASFVDGKYVFILPATQGADERNHVLEYIDDYGNSYRISVHLYRFVPESELAEGADTVTSGGTLYARNDFSMSWKDNVSASYSLNGGALQPFDRSTVFTEDGEYKLVFTDYAGNTSTRIIIKDSTVLYDITSDGFAMNNGAVVSTKVSISPDEEVNFTATKDGVAYSPQYRSFTDDGHYVVTVTDSIGNVSIFEFTIYTKAKQSFDFVAPEGFAFSQIWYVVDGHKISFTSDVAVNADGRQTYFFANDGSYEVEMLHIESNKINSFSIVIDNIPSEAALIGASNGQVTRSNVRIDGLKNGDKIYVYKNGQLATTYTVSGDSQTSLDLLSNGDFGEYSIVIEDEAGNTVSYQFTKEFATNVYANIFICILLISFGVIGIIYIRYNGKVRTK